MRPSIKRLAILSVGALLFACADMGYRVQSGAPAPWARTGLPQRARASPG
ncbi:hypothetical protein LP420_18685 [Massilia sp. B-10]|nr:hypothetical protein LP420_18685 [Massilia sp. B-10]